MSTLNYDHEIPEMIVQVARAAFPKGSVVMRDREELRTLFEDSVVVALYIA
jgi:hypothetical protein